MRLAQHFTYTLCALTLAACVSTNPATGGKTFSLVSESQEYSLGEKTARQAIEQEGLYSEKQELVDYYRGLGHNLTNVVERNDKPFEFIILDSPTYNAWATPGYINMYRGIFPYFNSEAELIGVMSHEAGHITARHTARAMTKGTLASVLVTGAAIYVGARTDSNQAAILANTVGGIAATVALTSYGRDHEREADSLALRYMGRLGYDPREAYNLFSSMQRYREYYDALYALYNDGKKPEKSPFYNILMSHPEPKERMQNVVEEVGRPDGTVRLAEGVAPATPLNDPQGQLRYFNRIDGLAVGPKLKHGVASKGKFYSKGDRFVWTLSEDMMFQFNDQSGWRGIHPQDKSQIFISGAAIEPDKGEEPKGPEEALRLLFSSAKNVERVDVDGRIGFTAEIKNIGTFRGIKLDKRARVVVLPGGSHKQEDIRFKDFVVLVFVMPKSADQKVRNALNNFQYISAAKADAIQPLRVQIHTVQAGESFATLANRMASGALQKEWFSALNGITAKTPLIPGMQVKLVVDPNMGKF